MNVAHDLVYGTDERHRFDHYPPDEPNGGSVVLIHGGGWWQGDKTKEQPLATTLAEAGFAVVVPNYRLAGSGRNRYPTQIDDVSAALDEALRCGLVADPSRLAAMGGSSGGNLAVEIGIRHTLPTVSWSGLLLLDDFMTEHEAVQPRKLEVDPTASSTDIDQAGANDAYYKWLVLNLVGSDDPTAITAATPVHRITSECRPMFLANSLTELVPQHEVLRVAQHLATAGVGSQTLLLPGSRHAEGYEQDAIGPTVAFLRRVLATP